MSTDRASNADSRSPGVAADTPRQGLLHIGFVITALVFVALYSRTYINLAEIWESTGTFQYAFLIFPISALLVWSRREWLARVVARPRPWAGIGLFGLGLLWLLGAAAEINLAQHVAVILVWPVLVYCFYGPRVAAVLAFALGYLVFAIPFGNFMVGPLQTVTAHMAVGALKLTGVPVLMDGHFIDTPASSWHVAEACSGIKFFVALTAFSVLYAHLFYTRWRRRILFVIAGMIVPIVANGLRVYFTILIGEYVGMHYATGTDHMIFGWQFFGLVLILLFLAGWPWHEPPPAPPAPEQGIAAVPKARTLTTTALALVLVVWPALWFATSTALAARGASTSAGPLPMQLLGQSALENNPTRTGVLAGVEEHRHRVYGSVFEPLRVDYLTTAAGRDVTGLRQSLYDPSAWRVIEGPSEQASADAGFRVQALTLGSDAHAAPRRLVYVFQVNGHWTPQAAEVKKAQLRSRLTGQRLVTGLLVLTAGPGQSTTALAGAAAAAADALYPGSVE